MISQDGDCFLCFCASLRLIVYLWNLRNLRIISSKPF
jgi:hypothetical protein